MRLARLVCLAFFAAAAANVPQATLAGYLGGAGTDDCDGVALDRVGDIYLACHSDSPDFPHLPAKPQDQARDMDAVVIKIEARTGRVVWATRTGGSSWDAVGDLAVAKDGSVYVLGQTRSADFPTTADAVERQFDWSLQFATYFGGSKMDGAYAVAVDSEGNPLISGVTNSADLPTTDAAFQRHRRGSVDAFVTKLDRDGKRILWSTYYGGSKENSYQFTAGALALDEAGRVWLVGASSSPDLPLRNPFQASYAGGDFDGFLAAFSPDGSKLCYGSYFGGNGQDTLEGLAVGRGKIYASGISSSTNIQQRRWQVQSGYGGGPYDVILLGLDLPANLSCR